MEAYRPNADALLAAIQAEDKKRGSGKLHIFFGMAAGVGKTYAMLEAARIKKNEGVDLLIAWVESHRRSETERLLEGLPVLPRRKIEYRGSVFEEMDLDEILKRKPELVLVDELAHTNVPGSRHPKRWQDVSEILDAGIDVYTTLNVQHLESRKEIVETITEISIRETVPDVVLERATQIELVDLSPPDLLKRLKEGKVYLGDKAQEAREHFFKEDRLTALRELALRFTAEKVDQELRMLTATSGKEVPWKATERLMVAISHSPYSEGLIRATRRIAYNLEAPWIATYIDTGKILSPDDRETLAKNIALARDLGGEVEVIADADLYGALKRIAVEKNVTQMIVGRPMRRWIQDFFEGGTLLDRLIRESGDLDVHVIRQAHPKWKANLLQRLPRFESDFTHYVVAFWTVVGCGILGGILLPFTGYRTTGFLFLLAVLGVSLFESFGPILLAAVLSALVWDFFFIPPAGTFHISEPEDIIMCFAYAFTATAAGILTRRVREREKMIREQEDETRSLYQIVKEIAQSGTSEKYLPLIFKHLRTVFPGNFMVFVHDGKTLQPVRFPFEPGGSAEKDQAVATWAFDHGVEAGWSTPNLGSASALYIPLKGPTQKLGVFAFHPHDRENLLSIRKHNLLIAVSEQVALSMERECLEKDARDVRQLQESEKLYQTILQSVSHELRTPLTAMIGSATALQQSKVKSSQNELLAEIVDSAERLNLVVANLLDMSRLSSGQLNLVRDWHDIADLFSLSIKRVEKSLTGHHVEREIEEGLPLVRIDAGLMEHVVNNILLNAAIHSPAGGEIEICAKRANGYVVCTISDHGTGVPNEFLGKIFEKFYRAPGSRPGGTGLGLATAKGIVDAHGGVIGAKNRKEGGLEVSIYLPIEAQPEMPKDGNA